MRIIHVLPNLAKGGAEKVTIDLANKQVSHGHEVVLLFANTQHSQNNFFQLNKSISIAYIGKTKRNFLLTYISCAAWIIRQRNFLMAFDVVHTHLTFGLIFGAFTKILTFFKKNRKSKLVFTCHLVGMNVSRFLIFFTRLNSFGYDNFVLMAHDRYWDERIAKNRKYVCIENGIEPLGVKRDKKTTSTRIGSLGRLVKDRKPELIINLFSEIQKTIEHTEFIVGGDGPLRSQLQDSLLGSAAERVVEFRGFIESPSDFYSNLDFYITLNVGATTGISGLEAVSSGIPTLAIQLDPMYENGEQDWIPSFSSSGLLIEYLQELIKNNDSLLAFTMMQKTMFEDKFTVESMASNYYAIYSK
jgi:glycosyltransferase involved in cell wall biosynthesis